MKKKLGRRQLFQKMEISAHFDFDGTPTETEEAHRKAFTGITKNLAGFGATIYKRLLQVAEVKKELIL